ncbi:hypothetical protein P5673_012703 [Acropora cervicornis]|uniref:Uncharacterized protein n=1 Tax=Acropora cervicornis TaxID=6130 RepID=A0AAD9V733_ACRCE|nr:hypothetical protein P5673_012703 [Acropora cervicornis]
MSVSSPVGDLNSSPESVLENYSLIFSSCVPCRESNKGCVSQDIRADLFATPFLTVVFACKSVLCLEQSDWITSNSISFQNEISIVRFTNYIGVFGQGIYRSLSPDLTAIKELLTRLTTRC